ncbi:uncharacterized protein FIBRA_05466 [Fibroporia radiculosa]|uniref:F-box domain-containing protein n=1 Tax=Fibroporia radiculosa TaxID=599839 RepID=J4HXK5_9APHY|nr:uncharacterized protein FIBRA_05466 [Fibroporia radiculosa]CCM03337.1 predicted protein [Fibroporia radiculosa]
MHSKRSLSPAPLPPPKRAHTTSNPEQPQASFSAHALQSTFDTLLYDEIVLVIFSHLSWADLCAVQPTNRHWSRLSLDNQLWKDLYLREYGRPRLRGVRGFIGRADGREVRPLPGRAKSDDVKDWKWMFRISSNWRTGRCSVKSLSEGIELPLSTAPSQQPPDLGGGQQETFLMISGNMTITASSRASTCPIVSLTTPSHGTFTMRCQSNRLGSTRITSLALDQSPPSSHTIRLAACLATGEIAVFSLDHRTPSLSFRQLTYVPVTQNSRTSPIIQAVYHHPLLVTLSQAFHLSLYDLSDNNVAHTQTLTSFTSHPPSSLVLSSPSPSSYKLVLAYAIPVYPSHWSVGATELLISTRAPTRMAVTTTRTTRAIDVPQGWIDEHKLRLMREQWARKVARVADTQTDGKWVVLAPGDPLLPPPPADAPSSPSPSPSPSPSASPVPRSASSPRSRSSTYASSSLHSASALQLYRLHLPASAASSSLPKLTFVRSLHGQIGPVSALSLADGRCVSLGVNGSIWVWDLEGGTGAEVSAGFAEGEEDVGDDRALGAALAVKGNAVFDERRIITADAAGVRVWRFDI